MKKRVLSIVLIILGLVFGGVPMPRHGLGKAQAAWLLVTGKGYPPRKEISETRKRLLARRAAVVDAYRLLAEKLSGIPECIVGSSGYKRTRGFIKGAEVKGVRYFPDGKVEVDLILLLEKGGGVCTG